MALKTWDEMNVILEGTVDSKGDPVDIQLGYGQTGEDSPLNFPKVHYAWPWNTQDWQSDKLQWITTALQNNVRACINCLYEYNGNPQDLQTIMQMYKLVTDQYGITQDLSPMYSLQNEASLAMPHRITDAEWDKMYAFQRDSYAFYWSQLRESNLEDKQPSVLMLNCCEKPGDFAWYVTWQNQWTYVQALSEQEKFDWDTALLNFYRTSHDIARESFPDSKLIMYTGRAHGWGRDGNGGIRMPHDAAKQFHRTVDNYRIADVQWMTRDLVREIQDIDRAYSGRQQHDRDTLPPEDANAVPLGYWHNAGPDRAFEMQYRWWRYPLDEDGAADKNGSVTCDLSYPWLESSYLNHDWYRREYRKEPQNFGPFDRIETPLFWPKLFDVDGSEDFFCARLLGGSYLFNDAFILNKP